MQYARAFSRLLPAVFYTAMYTGKIRRRNSPANSVATPDSPNAFKNTNSKAIDASRA